MGTGSVPPMPLHAEVETANTVYWVVMAAILVGMLAWWALSDERKVGAALPLLLVGGAISGMAEPFLDNVVLFWYPPDPHLPSFAAYGRDIPIWVPFGYSWFCGGLAYLVGRRLQSGATRGQVWAIAGGVMLIDFAAIGATSWLDVAGFYGDPPFLVAGYPLWWAAFDVSIALIGGCVIAYLLPRLHGWSGAYFIAVPPVVVGAASGIVGWPISTALNSNWDSAPKMVAAAMTFGLGALVVHAVASLVSRGNDAAQTSEPAPLLSGAAR